MIPPRILELAREHVEAAGGQAPRDPLGVLRAMVEISARPEYAEWQEQLRAREAAAEEDRRAAEAARRDAAWTAHRLSTYDPDRYPRARRCLDAAQGWVSSIIGDTRPARPWLLIRGPIGTGKSHLAQGCAHALHLRGRGVVMLPGRAMQAETRPGGRWEEYHRLADVDVLLIDDAGRWEPTPYMQGVVETVVSSRYDARRPTIVTTNAVQASGIFGGFGESADYLADRVRELAMVVTTGDLADGRWVGASQRGR